jgi:hypothetical protein
MRVLRGREGGFYWLYIYQKLHGCCFNYKKVDACAQCSVSDGFKQEQKEAETVAGNDRSLRALPPGLGGRYKLQQSTDDRYIGHSDSFTMSIDKSRKRLTLGSGCGDVYLHKSKVECKAADTSSSKV